MLLPMVLSMVAGAVITVIVMVLMLPRTRRRWERRAGAMRIADREYRRWRREKNLDQFPRHPG